MNELETQVGQIFISNRKLSRSFVSLLSERVPETNAEIFSLVEMPILNPAAWSEYDQLAKMLQTVLRRNFRRPNESAFENSIAQINDELSKQAAGGQTGWVGKMNACLAVRQGEDLYVATCGKIHAYLFRDKQLADISDSPEKPNPLKTFENFAVGKVLKKDFLIFTTTQLFNYISVERLKDILSKGPLAQACQNIAEIIRNLADESIAFGTFILELGGAKSFDASPILNFTSNVSNESSYKEVLTGLTAKVSQLGLSSFGVVKKINWRKTGTVAKTGLAGIRNARSVLNIQKFRALPRAKKFFLASAGIFAIVLIINLFVAIHVRGQHKIDAQINAGLAAAQSKINDANSAYIYNDKQSALQILSDAKNTITALPEKKTFDTQKNKMLQQIAELQNTIGGLKTVQAVQLANYKNGSVDRLKLSDNLLYLVNTRGNLYVPYDWNAKSLGAEFTLSSPAPSLLNSADNKIYYVDNGGNTFEVDTQSKQAAELPVKIPQNSSAVAYYGSPLKIYALSKDTDAILTAPLHSDTAPVNYLKQNVDLSNAIDFTIDGSVYVLEKNNILKFTSGEQKTFNNPGFEFSEHAKIFTDLNLKNIYIIDPSQNRLIVLDKNGAVKAQYTSAQFNDMKDFVVDEANKKIYILNGQSILLVNL